MNERVVVFNNMITPYTNRLYNALVDGGLDLAVLSCTDQEPDRSWAGTFDIRYPHRTIPGLTFPLSRSRHTHVNFGISHALNEMKPEVLLVNGFYPSMLLAGRWARANDVKLALTIDGWRDTMPDTIYHRFARPWLLRRCRAVICCSEKGSAYFRNTGIDDQSLFVVPLVPAWEPPSTIVNFQARIFDILWCARINDDAKNAIFFEQTVIALHGRIPGLRVRVVGSGVAERRMLGRFAAAGIDVKHDQHVPWQKISEVYQQCRLLLLPSVVEPWGLVCNEAMQCGVPCIVSPHVGAAGELVRNAENGYVCDLSVDTWVKAARMLLENPDRWAMMSSRSRLLATENTIGNSAERFVAAIGAIRSASA